MSAVESVAQARVLPAPIEGVSAKGPFAVGAYANALGRKLRAFEHVQLFGDLVNLRRTRVSLYFELRDAAGGGLPCAMWLSKLSTQEVGIADGDQVVVAGGCDFYPGNEHASPSFSFRATDIRRAGPGDVLAVVAAARKQLQAEGLFAPQKSLLVPRVPRMIGVVTGESGKARDDIRAALVRRGWSGRLVWAFVPVQDRAAAPRITTAVEELAKIDEMDVIIVARGGGSVMDLMAFSDERLCRTVAALRAPVVSSVGHHTDHTLLDDVAAVACSTPTHAAEAAVPASPRDVRALLGPLHSLVDAHDPRAVLERGFALVEERDGAVVNSCSVSAAELRVRFHDGSLPVRVERAQGKERAR